MEVEYSQLNRSFCLEPCAETVMILQIKLLEHKAKLFHDDGYKDIVDVATELKY